MEIRKSIALFIAMQITLLCFSQTHVQSREVKRIAGKAYILSNGNQYEIVENVVVAKLKAGKKQTKEGIKIISSHSSGVLEIAVPNGIAVEEYRNTLEKTGEFKYVEFNTYIKSCMSPNDPDYVNNYQWGLSHIDVDKAWVFTTGSPSIKIAVIDEDGFQLDHPDLYYGSDTYSNIIVSDVIDYVSTTNHTPTGKHGTMGAGIICAKTNNGIGIAGIAGGNNSEGVKIIPCRATTSLYCAFAIFDAVEKGVNIINMSFNCDHSLYFDDQLDEAYNNGVTLVCSTGNTGDSIITYPASHEHTIAVGAIDSFNDLIASSNYGTGLDLVAPGGGIKSTSINSSYDYDSGTSFAAPHVSGVVALMLSINPNLTPDEIRTILHNTTERIKYIPYEYNSQNWSRFVGYGLINACGAVMSAKNFSISGPTTICSGSQNIFSINDLPFNPLPSDCTVTWSTDNNNFHPTGSGKQCSVSYNGTPQYDVANLIATIRWKSRITNIITKRVVMHGTDMVAYGEQYSYVSPNGTFPYRQFTIPANNVVRTIPENLNREEFDGKESLPINFIEENTRDPHPPVDLCGYGITEINGGNKVFLSSTRLDGMNISFLSLYSPTYFYRSETSGFVIFEMPHYPIEYPVTLRAESNDHCHDFCLSFKVVPIPGVASGDDEIFISLDGSMLYVTFYGIGEYNGNGQYYMPSYNVTISKIPAGTQVYSNTFPGTQSSFSVNTSSWTSGFYSIRIVQGNNIYTKSIYL